ncbi:hypothetical protein LOY47_13020 [Pseudomonas brassicacearum]|uniref:hypothetical protein n=1 Tax=Pseudomonas brassicacearum TaxID=930166 RepID=UPI0011C0469B|nr:hypothetical protein [Pseudomonas brassicacearum]UVM47132.1 hypothetical protein LOY47_13020 [Pseudomonas brassicacearum]
MEVIVTLLDHFIDGGDTSIEAANRLEVLIDNAYPDDDFLQATVEVLACYRPEGGDFLFDVSQVRNRLVETRIYLMKVASL